MPALAIIISPIAFCIYDVMNEFGGTLPLGCLYEQFCLVQLNPNLHYIYRHVNISQNTYIRVYIDAFLSKRTFREVWAFLCWMHVWAFLIGIIAVGPMSAPDSLLIILVSFVTLLLRFLQSDIVLVLTQVNH